MQRTKVIILSVLALLSFASLAAASTMVWTSTSVKPTVLLRYQDPFTGKNIVQSFRGSGANFLIMNQDLNRDLYMTLSARNNSGLNVMAEAIGMGILLPSGASTAVLSWQDSLDPLVFEFPSGITMTAQSAIIKGRYKFNASNSASGNFTLDAAGTLDYYGVSTPARLTATFASGPMTTNILAGYSTISRGFTPPIRPVIPPTATPKTVSTPFGSAVSVNLLASAQSFQTNQALAATIVSQPSNGTLSQIVNGVVTYTPHSNFAGTDVFSFDVTDVAGNSSAVQLVTVTVAAGPSATPLLLKVNKNSTGTASLTLIDFSSLNLGANVYVSNVTGTTNGTITQTGSKWYYTPNKGFTGFDTLTYTLATTANNTVFATGEVDVEVCPIAVNYFQPLSGNSAQVNVLTNDIPFNTNDTLTVTVYPTQPPRYGTLAQSGTGGGTITYTLSGAIPAGVTEDHFLYTITESNTGQTSTGVVTILLQ
jgi:hypothetical protein